MLPVYICDDEENIRTSIRLALEKQILIQDYDMSVVACTHSPEEILTKVKQHHCQGIYFLDVELKNESMDGFYLGQAIRKLDPRGFLIYVTGFKDLAFETFKYHLEALDYIVKENPEQMYASIRNCLDIVTRRLSRENVSQPAYFTVRTADRIHHVALKDILYFETAGRTHRILLHSLGFYRKSGGAGEPAAGQFPADPQSLSCKYTAYRPAGSETSADTHGQWWGLPDVAVSKGSGISQYIKYENAIGAFKKTIGAIIPTTACSPDKM